MSSLKNCGKRHGSRSGHSAPKQRPGGLRLHALSPGRAAAETDPVEVRDVLTRPKLMAKAPRLTADVVDAFLRDMASYSTVIGEVPKVYWLDREWPWAGTGSLPACWRSRYSGHPPPIVIR